MKNYLQNMQQLIARKVVKHPGYSFLLMHENCSNKFEWYLYKYVALTRWPLSFRDSENIFWIEYSVSNATQKVHKILRRKSHKFPKKESV